MQKNYKKLSVRQIRDQTKNFLTPSDLLTQLTILGKGNRKLDLKKTGNDGYWKNRRFECENYEGRQ